MNMTEIQPSAVSGDISHGHSSMNPGEVAVGCRFKTMLLPLRNRSCKTSWGAENSSERTDNGLKADVQSEIAAAGSNAQGG
jgi:hypothetical protein